MIPSLKRSGVIVRPTQRATTMTYLLYAKRFKQESNLPVVWSSIGRRVWCRAKVAPNKALQPTVLPPLRCGKTAAELGVRPHTSTQPMLLSRSTY